jgi:hypothetical protein
MARDKCGIEFPHRLSFVLQGLFHQRPRLRIEHRDRLLSCVQINAYNSHLGLLRSEHR